MTITGRSVRQRVYTWAMEREQVPKSRSLRCVVLGPPGEETPEALRDAMARRGLRLEPCLGAHAAMARLVKPSGETEAAPRAMIIIEPKRVPFGVSLVAAAATYAPNVTVWRFVSSATPRLARMDEPMHEEHHVEAPPAKRVTPPDAMPALRLVGKPIAPRAPIGGDILDGAPDDDDDAPSPASLLTEAELELLLAVDQEAADMEGGCAP